MYLKIYILRFSPIVSQRTSIRLIKTKNNDESSQLESIKG